MTREQSIALVEQFLSAVNANDGAGVETCLHEDVVHETGLGQREFGSEAFRRSIVLRQAATGEQIGDLVVMASDDGTRAAAEFTRRGRENAAAGDPGKRYSVPGGMFFAIEDGKIIRVSQYGSNQVR
ncbi:MAG: nuclear transport factor 2 family protein [Rhizobiaceae bacterium]